MNRFNFGNQVTNGMQILSVAGTTGASWVKNQKRQLLADASSALNNMSEDEVKKVGQMRAEELRQSMRRTANQTDGLTRLSDDEQQKYGEKKADDLRKYINGAGDDDGDISVDELMGSIGAMSSPQGENLATAIRRNSEYLTKRNVGQGANGRFVSLKNEKKEEDE